MNFRILRSGRDALFHLLLIATGALVASHPGSAHAQAEKFDRVSPGMLPAGWTFGVTGMGLANWSIATDPSAPSGAGVLTQSGSGDFPWAVRRDANLADGYVEARFRTMPGRQEQAGSVIWRWKNARSYYAARADARRGRVVLAYAVGGAWTEVKSVDVTVTPDAWHLLRAEFRGNLMRVLLDGNPVLEARDDRIRGPGGVGIGTHGDAMTGFDDVRYGR